MTDQQLAAERRYTSAEVVQMLKVPAKWLKELVRDRRVPRQRAGAKRGVWFTAADIVEIGRMLPELMSAHRFSREAGPPGGQLPAAALAVPARRSRRPRS